MNKEEILAKSRAENNDEGVKNIENESIRIGFKACSCVFIFIILFNYFTGKDNYVPFAMFCAFAAAESYPKYTFTRNKKYIFFIIIDAIASILSLLSYVESVLG
ncbi:MAG: DUF6442 family protein [Lachnospiraceae bacterium]|nr:DUF6442 family protein [Lachnospiraceae bacterium]